MNQPLQPATGTAVARDQATQGTDEVSRFVEQMGVLCEREQMPRIAGRVLGLFLVEGGPLSLREVADRLKVSRASVSTNTRMLAELGLLERVGVKGDRQDYYQLPEAPFEGMLTGVVERMTTIGAFLTDSADRFPEERAAAKARLCGLASFYAAAADAVRSMLLRFGRDRAT